MKYFSDFRSSVFAIALTDSVHHLGPQKVPSKVAEYLKKVRTFVSDFLLPVMFKYKHKANIFHLIIEKERL
jgi:hypothetical protein